MSSLEVWMHGELCGTVTQTPQGDLNFKYAESYEEGSTPVSLSMPVGYLSYPKSRILPFLQGLLPDSESALAAIAKRFGANARNPFSLLTHIGHDVAGALQIGKAGFQNDHEPDATPAPLSDRQISELLHHKINEYEDATAGAAVGGLLSLAGAHPKLALRKNSDGHFTLPTRELASTHIIKPVPERWQNLDVVERQTMLAAASLGLNVAKTEIASIGGFRVFVAARFDRETDAAGKVTRIHQEDLCQALAVDPAKKYQREDGGPGVAAIADLFRSIATAEDRNHCAESFFVGLAFNVLARCTDAHGKNYSLALAGNRVRMTPLYDLASTVLYSGQTTYSAMSIGGEYRFEGITSKGWQSEVARLGVDPDWANERLTFLRYNLLEAFSQAGAKIRSATDNSLISRTTNALTDTLAQAVT